MRYQRIYSQIWHDEKFKELTPEAQRVFLYLLTSPHSNALGLYVLPEGYACTDLKLLPEPFKELFGELLAKGLIEYDATASLLYIVGHLKHNPIENENQAKFAKKIVDTLPISPLFTRLLERLDKPFHKPLRERLQERLGERYAKPVTVAVAVTVTKDSMSGKPDPASTSTTEKEKPVQNTVSEIITFLNQRLGTAYKPTTPKTQEVIRARLKEGFVVEDFRAVVERKAGQWKGKREMEIYLRPITLFGTRFESYLNETRLAKKKWEDKKPISALQGTTKKIAEVFNPYNPLDHRPSDCEHRKTCKTSICPAKCIVLEAQRGKQGTGGQKSNASV